MLNPAGNTLNVCQVDFERESRSDEFFAGFFLMIVSINRSPDTHHKSVALSADRTHVKQFRQAI